MVEGIKIIYNIIDSLKYEIVAISLAIMIFTAIYLRFMNY